MAIDFRAALKPPATIDSVLAVKSALSEYEPNITAMIDEANALTIHDGEASVRAVELGSQARKLIRGIEEIRKRYVSPLNDRVKDINAAAKIYTDRLGDIEASLKRKITIYQSQQEIERRKANEDARQAIIEEQARLNALAEKSGVEPVALDVPMYPDLPRVIRTESGASHQRKTWTFEILNPDAVPREYMMPDERRIREAVKNGVRTIAGVNIFQKIETVFR